jgi:hypothetical protein
MENIMPPSIVDALESMHQSLSYSVFPLDSFVSQRLQSGDFTAYEELVDKVNEIVHALRSGPDPIAVVALQSEAQPKPNFNLLSGRLVSKGACHGMAR